MSVKIRLGADPEIFLRDKYLKEFVSAHDLFPGTKKEPFKLDRGAVQVDGTAVEYNIDPVDNLADWLKNHEVVQIQIKEMLHKANPDLELVFKPWAVFDSDYFSILPLSCKLLGCDPDYGRDGKEKVPTADLQHSPMRTAAAHVHIGWRDGGDPLEENHFKKCLNTALLFEKAPGFQPSTNTEKLRIQYYGAPPSFRPKSYGVELRSPSNRWIATERGRTTMFNTVMSRIEKNFHAL